MTFIRSALVFDNLTVVFQCTAINTHVFFALAILFENDFSMVLLTCARLITGVALAASLFAPTSAMRPFHRPRSLDVPPVSESGYLVPLVGSQTCATAGNCKSSASLTVDIANT
jgi:hypothetical protein